MRGRESSSDNGRELVADGLAACYFLTFLFAGSLHGISPPSLAEQNAEETRNGFNERWLE